jgi:hypothetical protein
MSPEKERKKITLKIKKPVPKPSLAGNWKESDTTSMFCSCLKPYLPDHGATLT